LNTPFKKKEIVQANIESLAFGGIGVAFLQGFVVFVKGALPGQKVEALIVRCKRNYAEARLLKILTPSPFEVTPQCEHFGSCGGCLLQHLNYDEQLHQKQSQVEETLAHLGGFTNLKVELILPSPQLFYYRNKMEFSFANHRWLSTKEIHAQQTVEKNFALGLHIPGRFDKVLDITHCHLLSARSNDVLNFLRQFSKNSALKPYSFSDFSGYWRFIVFRESKTLEQFMVNIVTADNPAGEKILFNLAQALQQEFPFISTIVHNINRKKAQIAFGDEEKIIFGTGFIEENLAGLTFRFSANSFFQTNSLQTKRMYQLIVEWGNFRKDNVVYDLYAGTGSIGLFISRLVKKVVGFELVQQAIDDAKINCAINEISNCRFIQGDLLQSLTDISRVINQCEKPDVVIIDPPRSGMHPKLPDKIIQLNPQKIIYVSCNPATLARDLKILCEQYYQLVRIQPIDMFPHTAHCETVVLLEKI